jgi:hypothetical protein
MAEMLERCSKAIRASESAFLSTAAEFRRLRMQIKAEVKRIDDNRTAGGRLDEDVVARLVTMLLDFHHGVASPVLTNSCPKSDAALEMGCPPSSPSSCLLGEILSRERIPGLAAGDVRGIEEWGPAAGRDRNAPEAERRVRI